MNIQDALAIEREFYNKPNPNQEEEFEFTEAMEYLISETKDPAYMMSLGGYYYELRRFDLALKYYEMAEVLGSMDACECLGYIWYYGRTGERDYGKAYGYFRKCMDAGDLIATYKVADMYRNGYHVNKDYDRYCRMIEDLYPKVKDAMYVNEPLPEVFTRLARIRKEQGKADEAVDLYLRAKNFLAQRISYNPFFGNLNIMKWLVQDLYTIMEFDDVFADFYDLYYVLQQPATVKAEISDEIMEIESVEEDGEMVIRFGDKWFRTVDDFFAKADQAGDLLTSIWNRIYILEVNM